MRLYLLIFFFFDPLSSFVLRRRGSRMRLRDCAGERERECAPFCLFNLFLFVCFPFFSFFLRKSMRKSLLPKATQCPRGLPCTAGGSPALPPSFLLLWAPSLFRGGWCLGRRHGVGGNKKIPLEEPKKQRKLTAAEQRKNNNNHNCKEEVVIRIIIRIAIADAQIVSPCI